VSGAYHTGEAVSVPDLRHDDRFGRFCPRALDAGLAAVFTFPLLHGRSRLGALDLYRDAPGPLSPGSMSAAQTLADVAAAYILNARARADLQESAEKAREASLHDALTGLPNRTLMLERLEHAFRRGRRSHKPMALFFVDLDRFKDVNDVHGHQVGDELLVAVAERLTAGLRPATASPRMSGDEFVILCEDLDTPSRRQHDPCAHQGGARRSLRTARSRTDRDGDRWLCGHSPRRTVTREADSPGRSCDVQDKAATLRGADPY